MYGLMKNGRIVGCLHNGIESADAEAKDLGADSVVQVEVVREYPRLFTEAQRAKLMKKVDLRDYASMSVSGDGMELDIAEQDMFEMTDEDFLRQGLLAGNCDELDEDQKQDLVEGLTEAGVEGIDKILVILAAEDRS